mgnify:CR=1 FL=1
MHHFETQMVFLLIYYYRISYKFSGTTYYLEFCNSLLKNNLLVLF